MPYPYSVVGLMYEKLQSFAQLNARRIKTLLNPKRIRRADLNPEEIQPFVSACIKAVPDTDRPVVIRMLEEWGASQAEIENENNYDPNYLIEIAKKRLTRYMCIRIERELTPVEELQRTVRIEGCKIKLDLKALSSDENAVAFVYTSNIFFGARVVAGVIEERLMYLDYIKKFYFFNGVFWEEEPGPTLIVHDILTLVALHFVREHPNDKNKIQDVIKKLSSGWYLDTIVKKLKLLKEEGIWKSGEEIQFDGPQIKESITLQDGVIRFGNGKLIPGKADPKEYRRSVLPYTVEQVMNASKPEGFMKFMKSNFPNEDTLKTVMYYFSLIPSRNTELQKGAFFTGKTGCGKSTTISLLFKLFKGSATFLAPTFLTPKTRAFSKGYRATPERANLEGKLLTIVTDTPPKSYLNIALWKKITDGDVITARHMSEKTHEFRPVTQIIITCNDLPRYSKDKDDPVGRRTLLIPFKVKHLEEDSTTRTQDAILEELRPEFPGIIKLLLNYYVELMTIYKGKLPISKECSASKEVYQEDQRNPIDLFIEKCIVFEEKSVIPVSTVRQAYLNYFDLKENDKEARSSTAITRYLNKYYKGKIEVKPNWLPEIRELKQCYIGMRLKTEQDYKLLE
ncbi:hypothetical protein PilKf_01744 [Pillotina sp. SPG140]|jgi:phage/plasmid-associated DNA primase